MNTHLVATIIDTFDHIIYGIDLVNPPAGKADGFRNDMKRLPPDICVWTIRNIQSKAKNYEELQDLIPFYSNHVEVSSVDDILARI